MEEMVRGKRMEESKRKEERVYLENGKRALG